MDNMFNVQHRDASSNARMGVVTTPHGTFDTPAFMPVGTQATVKGLWPDRVAATGAQIILANTYHLMLRPGSELVAQMGGLQKWMRWDGPMLSDSGGYQVFSLADINTITDDGVRFKSHIDGAMIDLTPQRSMQVQNELGADIIMAFDDCPPAEQSFEGTPAAYTERVKIANERTLRWLEHCIASHARPDEQALFGIVQGGTDLDQRTWCAQRVCQFDLPGYAIGGVAVGEGYEQLKKVVEHTAPQLPEDRPRYLMGVGYERDLVTAVQAGVDMFDCVLPTRDGRNSAAFTRTGQIRLKNARFRDDDRPIEPGCDCPACSPPEIVPSAVGCPPSQSSSLKPQVSSLPCFSRSYIRHLFQAGEMLGPILVSTHNLRHFQRLMLDIRSAILSNDWPLLARNWPVVASEPAIDTDIDENHHVE